MTDFVSDEIIKSMNRWYRGMERSRDDGFESCSADGQAREIDECRKIFFLWWVTQRKKCVLCTRLLCCLLFAITETGAYFVCFPAHLVCSLLFLGSFSRRTKLCAIESDLNQSEGKTTRWQKFLVTLTKMQGYLSLHTLNRIISNLKKFSHLYLDWFLYNCSKNIYLSTQEQRLFHRNIVFGIDWVKIRIDWFYHKQVVSGRSGIIWTFLSF